ncbi:hypothetical protein D779_2887 [Imhoffiella purpurea]|uniref:Uncharacterized protein n=1 Tax=Imhoffiella purpurea TaxID=1249627 RepID=W9VB83_9GAMM|nr:hypothetical protein D779_2887 [Imhoffiella purpurea]
MDALEGFQRFGETGPQIRGPAECRHPQTRPTWNLMADIHQGPAP